MPRTPPIVDATLVGESGPGPIDSAHLRRYTLGEPNLEREVLQLFCEQLLRTLPLLDAAASDKDWRMVAHTLKGSGRAVGAWRLAAAAAAAEQVADQAAERRAGAVRDVEAAAREVLEHLGARAV